MQIAVRDQLEPLLQDMLYISESEYPLELLNLGTYTDDAALYSTVSQETSIPFDGAVVKEDADIFFEETISNLINGGDSVSAGLGKKYEQLYAFVQSTFPERWVSRVTIGAEVNICIIGITADNECSVIKTLAIET
ncbi:nuclease A inhibitor-like protein [Chitinophaga niastensis]|uniref:Nuclease A inhibitor-like protein n=1 Tax=Chitinophaga niastensis TaxID=536980 RepID=A0A2P8HHA0_CHINA|nr:nuclease A inhibitor family protein [Chitinophaga niastensis]PSL45602.1 nuclease A inhibitor-like protein [Chitinophaga niastensis]